MNPAGEGMKSKLQVWHSLITNLSSEKSSSKIFLDTLHRRYESHLPPAFPTDSRGKFHPLVEPVLEMQLQNCISFIFCVFLFWFYYNLELFTGKFGLFTGKFGLFTGKTEFKVRFGHQSI